MCGLLALADAEPERLQRLMARFVLASSSVNRKEILERAGIEFTVIASNADESNGPKAPDALVKGAFPPQAGSGFAEVRK